jgi:hypothetical protein
MAHIRTSIRDNIKDNGLLGYLQLAQTYLHPGSIL